MSFRPIYYITLACPTLERSFEMACEYADRGAAGIQIDIPSHAPLYESRLVRTMMGNALARYGGYGEFTDFFRRLRARYPNLSLHLVVYPDVVAGMGEESFVEFYREIGFESLFPVCFPGPLTERLAAEGMSILTSIDPDARVCAGMEKPERLFVLSYEKIKKSGESLNEKVSSLRERGCAAGLLAIEGIRDENALREVRDSGADGAVIGNVLMERWDDEAGPWPLFDAFQSLCG